MPHVERLARLIRWFATAAARACGLLVVLMSMLIGADVVARKVLNVTILSGGVGELSGYALAIVSVWGASLTLLNRAHIRIDTLQAVLPRRLSIAMDLLAIIAFTAASAVLAATGWATFSRSLTLGSRSMTPLAMPLAGPQGLWVAGLVFLTISSAWLLVHACMLLARGDPRAVRALIGARTAVEDLGAQQSIVQAAGTGGAPRA